MNRALLIPAVCCLVAFTALVVNYHRARASSTVTREKVRSNARESLKVAPWVGSVTSDPSLTFEEAEQLLASLSSEYLRPWRKYENSPHRLFSRVAPRPIPSLSSSIVLAPGELCGNDRAFLATITIQKGTTSQSVACVIDRVTRRVRLFSEGMWLTEDEWLEQAPVP